MFTLLFAFALSSAQASTVYHSTSDKTAFDAAAAEGKFYKPDEAPFVSRNFERAERATVRIGDNGSACTAVLLSEDGYAATAAHCIEPCLLPQWDGSGPPIRSQHMSKIGLYDLDFFIDRKFAAFSCPEYLNIGLYVDDYKMQDPQVIWVGKGLLEYTDLLKIPENEFQAIKDMGEDVVIVKYHKTDPSVKVTCLPVAEKKPQAGSALFTLGFPTTGDDPEFKGYHQALSFGRTRADILDDPRVRDSLTQLDSEKAKVYGERMVALWDHPYQLLASLRLAGGNSGGAMLNDEGELAGIVFAGIANDQNFSGQTAIAVSVPELIEQMKADLGEAKTNEIFNCPRQGLQAQNL